MKFLTTRQIIGEIECLIKEANKFVVMITPYVDIADDFLSRLREAGGRKVNIHIVFGKEKPKPVVENDFMGLVNTKIYFLENLHAKCYLNDVSAIMTSMNLYKASEKNREMGILFDRTTDRAIYMDIAREADSIIKSSRPYFIEKNQFEMILRTHHGVETGHCIRCNTKITFTPDRPLCRNCYDDWAMYFNYSYPEKFCHLCGKERRTSRSKPLCIDCYKLMG